MRLSDRAWLMRSPHLEIDRHRHRARHRLAIALRRLEAKLGFERIYVIGTPCSDNTTTENFHTFLGLLSDVPETISYLEFRADYRVELRYDDGRPTRTVPFLKLPLSKLPADFFPMTCKTCVDYTNVLADVTIGYMAGGGKQWLVVRNERGEELLGLLGDDVRTAAPGSAGKRQLACQPHALLARCSERRATRRRLRYEPSGAARRNPVTVGATPLSCWLRARSPRSACARPR